MSNRVTLVCHASTSATRQVDFPLDESLDAQGRRLAREQAGSIPGVDAAWSSPARRCVETADALGLAAEQDPELRECDYGHWRGRSLVDIASGEPEAVARWLSDPAAAPHGGESVLDLITRTGAWLENLRGGPRRVLAVTHAAVIRAAIVHAIRATPDSFWRLDVAPLTHTVLVGDAGRWNLRSIGRSCD